MERAGRDADMHLILSRLTLRVVDPRPRHAHISPVRLTPPIVVRETRGWEAPYERVKRGMVCCLSHVPSSLPPPF
jgi:hypothetical protein